MAGIDLPEDEAISIHALREEGDYRYGRDGRLYHDFYPRPPRGGRRGRRIHDHAKSYISIHALREEGDGMGTVGLATPLPFLSTPSARRATDREDMLQ